MKKLFLAVAMFFSLQCVFAQKLIKVSLLNDGQFDRASFDLGEAVLLHVSRDGQIVKWGVDVYAGRDDNFNDRLDEYTGKTGYFASTDDSAFRGKIKFIGRTYFTYYASYENEGLKGKIKSIGNINIDYYQPYENEAYRGFLKNVGPLLFTWYSSFDNESLRGKLKSIGNTPLNYYSSFDDKIIRGRIKSIDRASYTYYSSFDKPEYRGSLKTGAQTTIVNGIKYVIRW
jgi:hypothetical protein